MQRIGSKFAAVASVISVAFVVALFQQPGRNRQVSEVGRHAAPWGPGCNERRLASTFALEKAPHFEVTPAQQTRIGEVINELRRGYGGTLVCDPHDEALDSAAFLAHYLRAFSSPDAGISSYDYRFERIMSRLSEYPETLQDARLDWDVWRTFLVYENFTDGSGEFKVENTIYNLDSAADLLWVYLHLNGDTIKRDKARLTWWINVLTDDMRALGGRPLRRWLLLQLVASTDTETAKLTADRGEEVASIFPIISPDPYHPFLVVGSGFHLGADFDDPSPHAGPPFRESVARIAESQGLAFEVWEISDKSVPQTRIWSVDLAPRLSQVAMEDVIDQESWSAERQDFRVSFWRSVGSRSGFSSVHLPAKDGSDGVFFFVYNARLYVWPKSRMDDGVIQMLHLSGLIDRHSLQEFREKGFAHLARTMSSD
jgi:hypothetical protein